MRDGSKAWEIGISATNSRGLKGLDTFCFTPRAFIAAPGTASSLTTVAPVACCGGATIRHRYTRRPSGTAFLTTKQATRCIWLHCCATRCPGFCEPRGGSACERRKTAFTVLSQRSQAVPLTHGIRSGALPSTYMVAETELGFLSRLEACPVGRPGLAKKLKRGGSWAFPRTWRPRPRRIAAASHPFKEGIATAHPPPRPESQTMADCQEPGTSRA